MLVGSVVECDRGDLKRFSSDEEHHKIKNGNVHTPRKQTGQASTGIPWQCKMTHRVSRRIPLTRRITGRLSFFVSLEGPAGDKDTEKRTRYMYTPPVGEGQRVMSVSPRFPTLRDPFLLLIILGEAWPHLFRQAGARQDMPVPVWAKSSWPITVAGTGDEGGRLKHGLTALVPIPSRAGENHALWVA